MKKARIVLADDHPIVLAGLRMLIDGDRELEVVAQATSGPEALSAVLANKPDIAIIDVSLPRMNGIVLARKLAQQCPSVGVIMLTGHEDRTYLNQALEAGVRGFVLKKSTTECLLQAIRGVLVGGLYLDPEVAGGVFEGRNRNSRRGPASATALTAREAEVLRHVAHGLTSKQIGFKLDLSAKSVETYKARGLAKIGGRTRADIVRYAATQGWLADV